MGDVCGIDKAQINKAGSDEIGEEDCSKADDFNKTLKDLRANGKDAAFESSRQGDKLMGQDHKCAAANHEVAAVDTLKAKHPATTDRCGDAQRLYENAGKDRDYASTAAAVTGEEKMEAAKKAKNYRDAAKNYGEAAKNYGEAARNGWKAHDDFKLAEGIATKAGKKADAKEYHRLADLAEAEAKKDNKAANAASALEEKAEAHLKKPHK
jgi:hypothetical protein